MKQKLLLLVLAFATAVPSARLDAGVSYVTFQDQTPPVAFGGYVLHKFPADGRPLGAVVTTIPSAFPGVDAAVGPQSGSVVHEKVGSGWPSWGHGYTGDVYVGSSQVFLKLPPGTRVVTLDAMTQPAGSSWRFTVRATDGIDVSGYTFVSGKGFNLTFFGTGGANVDSILYEGFAGLPGVTAPIPVAVGEIAVGGPVDLASSALLAGTVGVPYSSAVHGVGGGGSATYTYALVLGGVPPGLSFGTNGTISGTPTTQGTFPFTAEATDTVTSETANRSFTISVSCPNVALSPGTLPLAITQVPFSQTITASGGVAPYTYLLEAGQLPNGLALSSAGVLSGKPLETGVFSFTVKALGQDGCPGYRTYALTVRCNLLTVAPQTLAAGTQGIAYQEGIWATGGVPPVTVSVISGLLPPGLSLGQAGLLSGVPTQGGAYPFWVQAVDANGCTGAMPFTVTIACTSLSISPPSLPGATTGVAYDQTLTAIGGAGSPTFSLLSGQLPPGLTLTSSGVLSGTPSSPGSYSFTVRAVAGGCTGTLSTTIHVGIPGCSPLAFTPLVLASGEPGVALSQPLTVSGGFAPYSLSVTAGSLPPGLSLTAGGLLSGTPLQAGSTSFTVTAVDAGGCPGSQAYALTIGCPAIAIGPASLVDGAQGTVYAADLLASGGVGPFTFALAAGALPPGVSLSAVGHLSGTPALGGTYSFGVAAIDSTGCTATKGYQLTVACTSLIVLPASLPSAAVAAPWSQQLVATGGAGAASFSLVTGALPPGITLSPDGLLSGTPSASGLFSFTVEAVDGGCAGHATLTIVVQPGCAALELTPSGPPLPSAGTCSAYALSFGAAGGTPPYVYAVTAGALPGGLALTATGELAGLPGAVGSFGFTVTVTDGNGCSASGPYVLDVTGVASATAAGATLLCEGATGTATASTAAPGATYAWSVTNQTGAGVIVGSAKGSSVTYAGTAAGVFGLTCKVSAPGLFCPGYAHVDVTVKDGTAPVVTAPPAVVTLATGVTASVPHHDGSSYDWSVENGKVTSGQGTSNVTLTAGYPGVLKLSVAEARADGCTTKAATRDVIVTGSEPCTVGERTLCLNGGRFRVTVEWENYTTGDHGSGQAVPLTSDAGYFWFLGEDNLELFVKVLDGRAVNGSFWVLFGALSDMEYTVTVTDTATGAVRAYHNPAHHQASVADVRAFDDASPAGSLAAAASSARGTGGVYGALGAATLPGAVLPATAEKAALGAIGCFPAADTLCLRGQRFRARVSFRNYANGASGTGWASAVTNDAGTFWFFADTNVELVVKVLDGTSVNGRFWVLWGALTDVEYALEVFDTVGGFTRTYRNPAHRLWSGADVEAF